MAKMTVSGTAYADVIGKMVKFKPVVKASTKRGAKKKAAPANAKKPETKVAKPEKEAKEKVEKKPAAKPSPKLPADKAYYQPALPGMSAKQFKTGDKPKPQAPVSKKSPSGMGRQMMLPGMRQPKKHPQG
jgi:hypothetical protein